MDYREVQRLSHKITQFERYRKKGLDAGFWGVSLDEKKHAVLDDEIPQRLIDAVVEADELMKSNSWEEAVRTLIELRDGWDDMGCEIAKAEGRLSTAALLFCVLIRAFF